jgi:riboflavin biosynthesis pyrimidine reductase
VNPAGGCHNEPVQILQPGAAVPDPLALYARADRLRPDGRCWVLANMVGGLDGSAAVGGRVGALSGPADRALFRALRALADVVMVGTETVRSEGYGAVALPPELAGARQAAGRPAVPPLAVVSRSLRLDWSAPAFAAAPPESRTLVITAAAADPQRLEQARAAAEVIIAGEDRVDPDEALRLLAGRGHRVVLCEGGPAWLGQLAAAGRLDELCLTIAPMMGGDPLPLSVTPAGAALEQFELRHVLADASTLFLRYERGRDAS